MVRAVFAVIVPALVLSSTGSLFLSLKPSEAIGFFFVIAVIIFYIAVIFASLKRNVPNQTTTSLVLAAYRRLLPK